MMVFDFSFYLFVGVVITGAIWLLTLCCWRRKEIGGQEQYCYQRRRSDQQ